MAYNYVKKNIPPGRKAVEGETKTENILFRATKDQKEIILAASVKLGQSMSEYALRTMLNRSDKVLKGPQEKF